MITTSRPTNHLCPRTHDEKRSKASRGIITGPTAGNESHIPKLKVCISSCANLSLIVLGYIGILSILIRKGGVG
jgi:hypothetical protein